MQKTIAFLAAIFMSSACLYPSAASAQVLVSYQDALQFAQSLLSDLYGTSESDYQKNVLLFGLGAADIKHSVAQDRDWKNLNYNLGQLAQKIEQTWYNPRYLTQTQLTELLKDHRALDKAALMKAAPAKDGLYDRLLVLKHIATAAPVPSEQKVKAAGLAALIRVNPANNVVSADSIDGEFQLAVPEGKQLAAKNLFPEQINLLDNVPALGSFAGGAPQYRSRLALIQLPLNPLKEVPTIVSGKLYDQMLNIPASTISNFIEKGLPHPDIRNIKLNIMVTGALQDGEIPDVNNLMFQGWIAGILKRPDFEIPLTDRTGPTFGIFFSDGLKNRLDESALRVDHFRQMYISSQAFDNGQFTLDPARRVETFWSLGAYKSKDRAAIITYHVLLNDPVLQTLLVTGLSAAQNAQDFVTQLEALAKAVTPGSADQKALINAATQIKELLTSGIALAPAHRPGPVLKPAPKFDARKDEHATLQTIHRITQAGNPSQDSYGAPKPHGKGEVQLSLINPKQITDTIQHPTGGINLYGGFPAIGVYGPSYNFRTRLLLIELPSKSLAAAPEIVRKAVSVPNVDLHVTIHGPLQSPAAGAINNLVFHGWTAKVEGSNRFSVNVPMGIFELQGIAPSAIAHNSLRAEQVYPHDPADLSPNNATFQIIGDRSVVSFWSVAQHKNTASVTFHVIIPNPKLISSLADGLVHALTAADVIDRLTDLIGDVADDDGKTLMAARDTIIKLLLAGIK
jgi:hypothetical protein